MAAATLTGIVNILSGTAGARLALDGLAMIVELERDPDHFIALISQQSRCNNRRIHAAGHGHHNAAVGRVSVNIQVIIHGRNIVGQIQTARLKSDSRVHWGDPVALRRRAGFSPGCWRRAKSFHLALAKRR